jgi:hypothetical protein
LVSNRIFSFISVLTILKCYHLQVENLDQIINIANNLARWFAHDLQNKCELQGLY